MRTIEVDAYVLDTLMGDLVGHDHERLIPIHLPKAHESPGGAMETADRQEQTPLTLLTLCEANL